MKEKTFSRYIVQDPEIDLVISVRAEGAYLKANLPRLEKIVSLRFIEHVARQNSERMIVQPIQLCAIPEDLLRTSPEEEIKLKCIFIKLLPPGSQRSVLDLLR